MERFIIKDINKETVSVYKSCFDSNNNHKKAENIDWQFLQNTVKKAFVDIAIDKESQKTAAIYAVSGVKFKINDEDFLGAQSLDTITDIDYRGQGLFIKLAKDVYEKAAKSNTVLVYGFPNGSSIGGFKKKLEWEVLDPLPFLIKPLETKYFFSKIKGLRFLPNFSLSFSKLKKDKNYSLVNNFSFPTEVNELWDKFSKNFKVGVKRDKEYLDWRYIDKPNENYSIMHCYDLNGAFIGYIVYTVKEKHNGKIGYIMELIYDLDKPEVGSLLINYAIDSIKKSKADCILSWCFDHSPNYRDYKKAFFLTMPEKFRPIELHFGVRSFNETLNEIIYNRENWYISYSDSDTV